MAQRRLFIPFTKVDVEKREVSGRLTQEMVDRDGEIWDYDASIPHMKAWSDSFVKATSGKSYGNLRAMHRNISAGKLTSIDFNDKDRAVDIVAKVVDDAEWEKLDEGVYTGFSLGGNVVRSWHNADDKKHKRFEIKPSEASLADYPAVPSAVFEYVKLGGLVETRHFNKVAPADGTDHTESATVRSKRERMIDIDALRALAKKSGVTLNEKALAAGDWTKGLYDVGQLAGLVESLTYLQRSAKFERESEGDASAVPDELLGHIEGLLGTLKLILGEEADEVLERLRKEKVAKAATAQTSTQRTTAMPDEKKPEFAKAFSKAHLAKVANIHEHAKAVHKLFGDHVAKIAGTDQHETANAIHKMMGDHCDKIAGFMDEVGGLSTTEPDIKTAEKIAGLTTDFAKVSGERDELKTKLAAAEQERDGFKKTAEELAEAGTKLLAANEVRKGSLVVVDRKNDGVASLKVAEGGKPADEEPKTPQDAFKKAFQSPKYPTAHPGAREAQEAAAK